MFLRTDRPLTLSSPRRQRETGSIYEASPPAEIAVKPPLSLILCAVLFLPTLTSAQGISLRLSQLPPVEEEVPGLSLERAGEQLAAYRSPYFDEYFSLDLDRGVVFSEQRSSPEGLA